MPRPLMTPRLKKPFVLGSGKFGIPCERMHAEYLSPLLMICWCCAAVIRPSSGSRCSQALLADAGAWKSPRFALVEMKFPWLSGSGQEGAPWERMHCA